MQIKRLPILQLTSPFLFWLLAFWVTLGKSWIFDVGGWGTLIRLFTLTPFLAAYGLVFGLVTIIRYTKSGYVFGRSMNIMVGAVLFLLFVHGLTYVDGGDTQESFGSAFTVMLGVRGLSSETENIMNTSNTIAVMSLYISGLLLILMFIYSFFDKGKRTER